MEQSRSFDEIESRLGVIVDAVSNEAISLDEALALFEEAVGLGLAACEITENEIRLEDEQAPVAVEGEPAPASGEAVPAEDAQAVEEASPVER